MKTRGSETQLQKLENQLKNESEYLGPEIIKIHTGW